MAETLQFIDERLSNSITAVVPPVNPVDRLNPLTFTDWLSYNTQLFTTTSEFLNRYQSYLSNWYAAKGMSVIQASAGIQTYYTNLINELVINYTSKDERRYLQNIDISNSRDLAIIVPFFSQKIKDICIYYSSLRDEVKTATTQYNLKGSNVGIENLLYVNIIKSLQSQSINVQLTTLGVTISSISDNIVIDIEDLYDTYTDYYDVSPTLPASAYNVTTGLRKDYFSLDQNDIDPYLFININQSILKAILSYPFYTIELGTNNFAIDPLVNSSQLNLLKDSDYITTVNDSNADNLNLQIQSQEITKYIGADFYYIATASTRTAYTSGLLFKANSEFANVLNKRYPTIAAVPSQEFLKIGKEIGLFFKPDKIGLSNFTNFNFTPSIDVSKLEPNSVYYFPDPSKYGNVSGNTKINFQSPLSFFEKNYFNKTDYSNQYKFGDVASDPYYQTFRAYQSREQTLNQSYFGVQRYTDPQDFFTGDQDTIWSNEDVFPITPFGEYPIAEKTESLLPINKTLVQYKSDVYGNQYGLYKNAVNKQFSSISNRLITMDFIFDGYVFNLTGADVNWPGWNVAEANVQNTTYTPYGSTLNYSGVTLRTSINEVYINSDNPRYFTSYFDTNITTALSGSVTINRPSMYIDDGATFDDGGDPFILESYDFKTNDTTYGYVPPTTYTCIVRDAASFTRSNSSLLPDSSSDQSTYNPVNAFLYYNDLVDGAPQPTGPNGVATFDNQAQFFANNINNMYITEVYDGSIFYDYNINSAPCPLIGTLSGSNNVTNFSYAYSEPTTFANVRLANTDTVLDYSLSGINNVKNSLYYTRNIEYGDFYFRNASNTFIGPVSSSLSAVLANYSTEVQTEIANNVINFDLYYDTLQIETENYLVLNKIIYDYDSNQILGTTNLYTVINRGNYPELEKFSTVWFDEKNNTLMFAKTTLHHELSATNYKAIYPTIYTVNLINGQINQVYPAMSTNTVTFAELSSFSLFGKDIELDIVRVEKPTLNYSSDTGYYTLSYLGKDTANCFYIITIRYQYNQNIIQNISCTLHKPATDVYNITFANQLPKGIAGTGGIHSPYFDTYTVAGSAAGRIAYDNTFVWGYDVYA
jgi:hypothetical protein